MSVLADSGVPFGCEPLVAMVVFDELEEMDDDDEDRVSCLRGANMALTWSGFMGLLPLTAPHAGLEI